MSARTSTFDAVLAADKEKSQQKENRFAKAKENPNKAKPKQETDKAPETVTNTPSEEMIGEVVLSPTTPLKNGKVDVKSILLSEKKKPKSKSRSLYLDDDIYEKLDKVAKSNHISVSKALNELLRSIL